MMLDAVSGIGVRSLPVGPTGGVARPSGPMPAAAGIDTGNDFASMLGNAITDFGNKLRQAEAVSIGGVKGTASMQDVVEHVMSAEQSLQAVIAVRDKVISAYQEISRMAI
jgi:flagellar hook-basal body complex protein FliE